MSFKTGLKLKSKLHDTKGLLSEKINGCVFNASHHFQSFWCLFAFTKMFLSVCRYVVKNSRKKASEWFLKLKKFGSDVHNITLSPPI